MEKYYVIMKKGNKEICGSSWVLGVLKQYIQDNIKLGYEIIDKNF